MHFIADLKNKFTNIFPWTNSTPLKNINGKIMFNLNLCKRICNLFSQSVAPGTSSEEQWPCLLLVAAAVQLIP
jgi:hypothetical protein